MSARHVQDRIEAQAASTAHQMSDSAKEFAEDVKEKVSPYMATAREKFNDMGQQLRDRSAQLKDRAVENAQAADAYVRDNPWTFIGLGLVTGFLASWYLTRRER